TFPDVVQEAHPLGERHVQPHLRRHQPCQDRDLLRVLQLVLAVRCPKLQTPQHLHDLGVHAVDPELVEHLLGRLDDELIDLFPALGDDLLDPTRMDPAIRDQLLEAQPRRLPPDRVETRQDDRLGRVIDDHVDPGRLLEGADVPTLAPDDPALHLVRREAHHRDRALDGLLRGHPLDRERDDVLRLPLGIAPGLLLDLPDHARGLGTRLVLDIGNELTLRLLRRQTRDRFEATLRLFNQPLVLRGLLLDRLEPLLQLPVPRLDQPFLLVELIVLPVQPLPPLLEPPLELLDLLPPVRLPALPLLLRAVRRLSTGELTGLS